jgi:cytochrome c oxidase subunit 4
MSGHIVSVKLYIAIFIALLGLTALTTGVAYIDLGAFNTVAALAIAVVKMLLVILFFMHVKYSPRLTKLVLVAAFFWLGLLLTFTLTDVFTRSWTPVPQNWGPAIAGPTAHTK